MKIKVFLLVIFISNILSADNQLVPISDKRLSYKSKIYNNDLKFVPVNSKFKCTKYLDMVTLKQNKYHAQRYIRKNTAICLKDVYVPTIKKVKFRFGNLEIEKEAELIKETKTYIKIKNLDGTIEKIYTDGRN